VIIGTCWTALSGMFAMTDVAVPRGGGGARESAPRGHSTVVDTQRRSTTTEHQEIERDQGTIRAAR